MKWLVVVVFGLGLASLAQALEIYHWVDDNGQPHYSQSSPIGIDAELISVDSGGASSQASADATERKLARDAALKAGREAREAERVARQEAKESGKQGKQDCAEMQRVHEQFVSRSRVYDSVEHRYLTETERQSRISELSAFLSQNCN